MADVTLANRMVVAFFVPSLGGGGAERATLDFASGLDPSRYRAVVIVEKSFAGQRYEVAPHVAVIELGASSSRTAFIKVFRCLRRIRPDVLYAALPHINILAAAARVLMRGKIRLILSVHNNLSREFEHLQDARALRLLTPWAYRQADAIVCVSKGVASECSSVFGADPRKIRVIHNPIDVNLIRQQSSMRTGHPWMDNFLGSRLVAAGRLTEQKNVELLIYAVAELVRRGLSLKLVVLGAGEERQRLEALTRSLSIRDHVDFAGAVANPFAYMRRASAFVLSSNYEGFGMVIVEALAAGAPVVATDCEFGPREILGDNEYGLLCPPGSIKGLADAIQDVLDDIGLAERLRTRGKERATEFDKTRAIAKLEEVLLEASA